MLEMLLNGVNYGLVALGTVITFAVGVIVLLPVVGLISAFIAWVCSLGGEKQ